MLQVIINIILLSILIISVLYFGLLGSLHLSDYMQNKRAVKREHKYDYLLNTAK